MKKGWMILLLFLCGTKLLFGQSEDSIQIKKDAMVLYELKLKISNYHSMFNADASIHKKIKHYEQFSSIAENTGRGMVSALAIAFAKSNHIDSSAFWLEKIKNQEVKIRVMIHCAKEFARAGNKAQAIKLYRQGFDYFERINSPESKDEFGKAFYEYMALVPQKGDKQAQQVYLKYLYEANENSFPTDIGYYWGNFKYDARKLLFYNYAQLLVGSGEVKRAAQVIADAVQSGIVPDSMVTVVERDFEHVPRLISYLKQSKLAGKVGFRNDFNKLLAKRDVNGKVWNRSDFDRKYVMIDFWGSWCLPCRFSHPHLKEVYEKYKDKGLEIVGVGYEQAGDLDKAKLNFKKAITEDKLDWVQYLNNENADQFNPVKSFGVAIFPTKILVDPTGKEIARFKGGKTDEMDAKFKEIFGF